eukprot:6812424-Prymnesium_polylepis.1
MRNFGAGATCGSVEDALVRSTRGGRSRPGGWANEGCCLAALGRMLACYLMRDRKVRCMDALGPRRERVSTVNRAL